MEYLSDALYSYKVQIIIVQTASLTQFL